MRLNSIQDPCTCTHTLIYARTHASKHTMTHSSRQARQRPLACASGRVYIREDLVIQTYRQPCIHAHLEAGERKATHARLGSELGQIATRRRGVRENVRRKCVDTYLSLLQMPSCALFAPRAFVPEKYGLSMLTW